MSQKKVLELNLFLFTVLPFNSTATFFSLILNFFNKLIKECFLSNTNCLPFNCIFAIFNISNTLTIKKMKHKIIVINGPNLNLLGEREKDKYGNVTLKQIEKKCKEFGGKKDILVTFKQSNIEGKIVDFIQQSRKKFHGLVINAGGYTHTSVAIRDALAVLTIPIVELHITNIYNREDFRHKSLISNIARSIICGFGPQGYILALQGLKEIIKDENR